MNDSRGDTSAGEMPLMVLEITQSKTIRISGGGAQTQKKVLSAPRTAQPVVGEVIPLIKKRKFKPKISTGKPNIILAVVAKYNYLGHRRLVFQSLTGFPETLISQAGVMFWCSCPTDLPYVCQTDRQRVSLLTNSVWKIAIKQERVTVFFESEDQTCREGGSGKPASQRKWQKQVQKNEFIRKQGGRKAFQAVETACAKTERHVPGEASGFVWLEGQLCDGVAGSQRPYWFS